MSMSTVHRALRSSNTMPCMFFCFNLEFCRQILIESTKYRSSRKSVQWKPKCSVGKDRETDTTNLTLTFVISRMQRETLHFAHTFHLQVLCILETNISYLCCTRRMVFVMEHSLFCLRCELSIC